MIEVNYIHEMIQALAVLCIVVVAVFFFATMIRDLRCRYQFGGSYLDDTGHRIEEIREESQWLRDRHNALATFRHDDLVESKSAAGYGQWERRNEMADIGEKLRKLAAEFAKLHGHDHLTTEGTILAGVVMHGQDYELARCRVFDLVAMRAEREAKAVQS